MDVQPIERRRVSETSVELFAAMLRARIVDERLAALGDAGVIGFMPRSIGREAALFGTVAALEEGDWIFPTHYDWTVSIARNMSIATLIHRVVGNGLDPLKGHDMPSGLSARAHRIASVSAPAATHLPHAVGVAIAARQRGEDVVSVALFDALEVDAADFHSGLNFAGVMQAPTLFVCRVREGEDGAAEHAAAYGLAADRCDGSDVSAVIRAVGDARRRAGDGEGATVIDVTLGADPIEVARARLGAFWTAEREDTLRSRTEDELSSAIDAAASVGDPSLRSLFDDVYAELPPHLRAQLEEARR